MTPRGRSASGSSCCGSWQRRASCWRQLTCRSRASDGWHSPATAFAGSPPPGSTDRLRPVETIQIHPLVPGDDEVTHELLFGVVACVDFGERSELGVRAEDEVYGRAGPSDLARLAIEPLVHVLGFRRDLPLRV